MNRSLEDIGDMLINDELFTNKELILALMEAVELINLREEAQK